MSGEPLRLAAEQGQALRATEHSQKRVATAAASPARDGARPEARQSMDKPCAQRTRPRVALGAIPCPGGPMPVAPEPREECKPDPGRPRGTHYDRTRGCERRLPCPARAVARRPVLGKWRPLERRLSDDAGLALQARVVKPSGSRDCLARHGKCVREPPRGHGEVPSTHPSRGAPFFSCALGWAGGKVQRR